ncbi:hypothetical protein MESS2_740025 [Mesorhizobium metallidurans STM 2683]|uniref:Uncharacterized protein n=1 Tax=Mesorhizobium metallidurans STM 2683 TaxID=1297569 RepID=M5EWU2_9HYPH|nr:hypothetical protein MESS2_740025 [Mesorhizobium metallidurans STM 2683]
MAETRGRSGFSRAFCTRSTKVLSKSPRHREWAVTLVKPPTQRCQKWITFQCLQTFTTDTSR